jgi:hypothetical protein
VPFALGGKLLLGEYLTSETNRKNMALEDAGTDALHIE